MEQKMQQVEMQIEDLQQKILEMRGDPDAPDQPLKETGARNGFKSKGNQGTFLKPRRNLRGHFGKIYALSWSGGNPYNIVTASQDGKLIVWNAKTSNKLFAIPLRSAWVMTCAYSPSGRMVACGGLDNLCTVYRLPDEPTAAAIAPYAELSQHEGYLSCCRFIGDRQIITSSGDSQCILWDIEQKAALASFTDHTGDVMSVSICEGQNFFVSGSCDATARMWDYRINTRKACVKTFPGHESDINSVDMFPNANAFGTGSDDSSIRIFDIRAYGQVNRLYDEKLLCGVTSVAFSGSGRWIFGGYDDYSALQWNTVTGDCEGTLQAHDGRVSCLGLNSTASALCTGSWDTTLMVWA